MVESDGVIEGDGWGGSLSACESGWPWGVSGGVLCLLTLGAYRSLGPAARAYVVVEIRSIRSRWGERKVWFWCIVHAEPLCWVLGLFVWYVCGAGSVGWCFVFRPRTHSTSRLGASTRL